MSIGTNIGIKDKLIKSTTNGASNTNNTSKKSNTIRINNTKATDNTVKMTFYVKQDLLEKIYNFAYWDRHSVTEAINIVITDGLKGKITKNRNN